MRKRIINKIGKLLFIAVLMAAVFSFAGCKAVVDTVNEVIEDAGGSKDKEESGKSGKSEDSKDKEKKEDSGKKEDPGKKEDSGKDGKKKDADDGSSLDPDGSYTTKEDVALYLYTYGKLPSNFITKAKAKELGWSGGSLEEYAPGFCIGGDHFGNYEERLPEGEYHECDIDTLGAKSRGSKRLVYSDDGRIYYTEDHYEHFELLYGEE